MRNFICASVVLPFAFVLVGCTSTTADEAQTESAIGGSCEMNRMPVDAAAFLRTLPFGNLRNIRFQSESVPQQGGNYYFTFSEDFVEDSASGKKVRAEVAGYHETDRCVMVHHRSVVLGPPDEAISADDGTSCAFVIGVGMIPHAAAQARRAGVEAVRRTSAPGSRVKNVRVAKDGLTVRPFTGVSTTPTELHFTSELEDASGTKHFVGSVVVAPDCSIISTEQRVLAEATF
jgi:hypothetical protein